MLEILSAVPENFKYVLFAPVIGLASMAACNEYAKSKGHRGDGWSILGFFTGPIGFILTYFLINSKEVKEPIKTDKKYISDLTLIGLISIPYTIIALLSLL